MLLSSFEFVLSFEFDLKLITFGKTSLKHNCS